MEEVLSCSNVWFRYPDGTMALRDISLELFEGETIAILGPNGAGKSTLLLVMAGLLRPWRGVVCFRGRPLSELGISVRRRIGVVFQDPDDQLFCPTVFDDVAYALRQLQLSEKEVKSRVMETASLLGFSNLLARPSYKLSFGEKKMVALATVLVYEPELLLLDEPTLSMSPRSVALIGHLIERGREGGRTHILATQDLDFAYKLADRILILVEGKIKGEGPPDSIVNDSKLLEEAELRASRVESLGFSKR
jgi:cobalt/nickel transport system ATP-binding protein